MQNMYISAILYKAWKQIDDFTDPLIVDLRLQHSQVTDSSIPPEGAPRAFYGDLTRKS